MEEIVTWGIWLLTRWWYWAGAAGGLVLSWYLSSERVYKVVDGKAFVRHGKLGRWEELGIHIGKEHSEKEKED